MHNKEMRAQLFGIDWLNTKVDGEIVKVTRKGVEIKVLSLNLKS